MRFKEPRSVQIVIFSGDGPSREYLMLRRITEHGGFWQSVTGSLEEGESHRQAAAREVAEETGIIVAEERLVPLDLVNTFEIAAAWRSRYAPGITVNEEVCFALQVEKSGIIIDHNEHDEYSWVTCEQAGGMLYWESTRRAVAAAEKLPAKPEGRE